MKHTIKFGPRAPQKDFFWNRRLRKFRKDEDCLYLNVFAPAWQPPEGVSPCLLWFIYIYTYLCKCNCY